MDISAAAASDGKGAASGDGDYDGVCELLHSHMLETAHVSSFMLCVLVPVYMWHYLQLQHQPAGDQDIPAGDQDRPTGDQDGPAGDQDRSTGGQDTSLPAQDRPLSASHSTSSAPQRGQIGKVDSMSYIHWCSGTPLKQNRNIHKSVENNFTEKPF